MSSTRVSTSLTLPRNKGVTLIELMIVLSLMGMLFLMLFGTYFQIKELLYTQSASSIQSHQVIGAVRMLTKDIENTVFEAWHTNNFFSATKNIVAARRADILNFPSGSLYHNPSTQQARLFNVTYHAKVNDDGVLNLYRREDAFISYKHTTGGIDVPIFDNLQEFRCEFSGNGEDWEDGWSITEKKKPPAFVRVTLKWEEDMNEREFIFEVSPGIFTKN